MPCQVIAFDKFSADTYGIKLRGKEKELWWRMIDIEKVSKSKEEIEIYLQARKYNL